MNLNQIETGVIAGCEIIDSPAVQDTRSAARGT